MKVTSQRLQAGFLAFLVTGALGVLGWSVLGHFGSNDPFMPHAHCYLMIRELILLHGVSDLFIGAAYVAISATLTYLVLRARREIPFHWMMLAFATFIVACGATHFMEVWTLTDPRPQYWLAGDVKLLTALASVATAFCLPPLVPKILRLLQEARVSAIRKQDLEKAHAELTKLYAQVRQLDELKTSFFSNVSHELRTPLALIFGPVDRLLEQPPSSQFERTELRTIRRNALLLHKHVNDLLDVSKLEAGKMRLRYSYVDITRLVRMVADYFTSSNVRPLDLRLHAPDNLTVQADSEKVQRILFNLLANAFKFTPSDGHVSVHVESIGDCAVIRVEDTGPGISPEFREKIFERYQQGAEETRRGGTGLGLSIAREFAELHGGSLSLGEVLDGGASFVLSLPLVAPQGTSVEERFLPQADDSFRIGASDRDTARAIVNIEPDRTASELEQRAPPGSSEILIVEDNAEMADLIAQTLSDAYLVRTAPDGNAALKALDERLPDLVLTDLMMPGMTGDQLLTRMRATPAFAHIPVILLTAKADEEMKLKLLQQGAQDYLVKPFAIDELRVRVRNQIATKEVRDMLQEELATQEQDIARLVREVTQRARDLEKAKFVAETANKAKDQFLAVLSHELRTPLTPALATAINLEQQLQITPGELKNGLGVIRRNIELEARLIDDLLDLTRIAKGKLQIHFAPVDVHEAIRNALEMCQSDITNKRSKVDLSLEATKYHVNGDAPRLLQVIWNLLLNAVKFTPAEGRISISTYNRGTKLVLTVTDTGVGISSEAMPRIFDPFEQGDHETGNRSVGGLGLGLAVARGLIEAQGGSIRASSDGHGTGSTFSLEFECFDAVPVSPDSPSVPTLSFGPASLRIFLVEDHQDTREAIVRLLQRWGYWVETAASLAEARQKLQGLDIDVLVSDLGLPDGHGTELMSELRSTRAIKGIAISGFGMEEDIRQCREAGFCEHLTKPVAAQRLRSALEQIATGSDGQS